MIRPFGKTKNQYANKSIPEGLQISFFPQAGEKKIHINTRATYYIQEHTLWNSDITELKSAVTVTFIPNFMVMISMTTSKTTFTWTDSYCDCDAGSVLRNPDSSLPAASEAILNH